MARTIRTKVYKFNELNKDAKEKAIDWYRNNNQNFGYAWADEINESFEAVSKNVIEPLQNIESEISGTRLYAWIQNNLSHLWIRPIFYSKHKTQGFKKSTYAYKYDECLKFRRSKIAVENEIDNCPFTGVCYENQNNINSLSLFDSIKRDSAQYAKESGEDVAEYLMRDFDACPEGWDCCFEFSYGEVSSKAKEERRNVIERILKSF